ncbi:MAG: hypothetical protein ABWY06_22260 [Pseudomonas sp.]|uniref:hypothetical protein n=1 Tax=Pseudomonas sp. TaxID=306 RepID=UPI00339961C9
MNVGRLGGLLLGLAGVAQAELKVLDDTELAEVQGAGIGFVLENVLMDASQATITVNDITNAAGQNVPISVKEFYFGAAGSNKGANLMPVSIGRLNHPFEFNLAKGEALRTLRDDGQWVQTTPSNVAVLEFKFPERLTGAAGQPCVAGFAAAGSSCSSRASEKVDLGIRYDFQVAAGRTDVLNIDIRELTMDGSYLRLWGDKGRAQLVGEMRLNLFAKGLEITSCATGTAGCSTAAELTNKTLYLGNGYANIALGYGKSQPLLFDVSSNGQFVLELPNPVAGGASASQRNALAADFYANAPRTSILIDSFKNGTGLPASGGYNFGRSEISGMSFNYLRVTSRDL